MRVKPKPVTANLQTGQKVTSVLNSVAGFRASHGSIAGAQLCAFLLDEDFRLKITAGH